MVTANTCICALCGIQPATTDEHIPAKSLFDQPRPNDLITVPACGPCNYGTQPDDDYFRDSLALIAERTPSAALERIRPKVTRSFARPQQQGLRAHFESKIKFAPLPGGLIHQPVIEPNSKRIQVVVAKHAVGLYYEVMREVLPPNYGTMTLPLARIDKIPQEDHPHWENIIGAALSGHTRAVGDGSVFRFAFNVAHDNHHAFVAVLLYYDNFAYAVYSNPRPAGPPAPT